MTKRSEDYVKGIATKPYDLIREGLIFLGAVLVIVLILAGAIGAPDYPAVTGKDVANIQPVAYLQTCANILAGNSGIEGYGPPYTHDTENAQKFIGLAPQNWFGVKIPINPAQDFVINPLEKMSVIDPNLTGALNTYKNASADQQQAWDNAYLSALDKASVSNGQVSVPSGDYGPLPTMMDAMLKLGKSGMLEGALESTVRQPFVTDFTIPLLFFQDDVDGNVADKLDMTGEQWGVAHEDGNYPGAWWLDLYAFWYQIPPMNTSDNADIQAIVLMTLVLLLLVFLPLIPVLNRIPRWIPFYRVIWRDWYKDNSGSARKRSP